MLGSSVLVGVVVVDGSEDVAAVMGLEVSAATTWAFACSSRNNIASAQIVHASDLGEDMTTSRLQETRPA